MFLFGEVYQGHMLRARRKGTLFEAHVRSLKVEFLLRAKPFQVLKAVRAHSNAGIPDPRDSQEWTTHCGMTPACVCNIFEPGSVWHLYRELGQHLPEWRVLQNS